MGLEFSSGSDVPKYREPTPGEPNERPPLAPDTPLTRVGSIWSHITPQTVVDDDKAERPHAWGYNALPREVREKLDARDVPLVEVPTLDKVGEGIASTVIKELTWTLTETVADLAVPGTGHVVHRMRTVWKVVEIGASYAAGDGVKLTASIELHSGVTLDLSTTVGARHAVPLAGVDLGWHDVEPGLPHQVEFGLDPADADKVPHKAQAQLDNLRWLEPAPDTLPDSVRVRAGVVDVGHQTTFDTRAGLVTRAQQVAGLTLIAPIRKMVRADEPYSAGVVVEYARGLNVIEDDEQGDWLLATGDRKRRKRLRAVKIVHFDPETKITARIDLHPGQPLVFSELILRASIVPAGLRARVLYVGARRRRPPL